MPDNKLEKRVSVSFSKREYENLRSLAYMLNAKGEIKRGVSNLLRDVALHFISINYPLISQLKLIHYQYDSRHQRFSYPKIRQAIEVIRDIQNNALKMAINEEEDINHA